MPCTEKRARLLLESGRARVHKTLPMVIRLVDRLVETSVLQPHLLKQPKDLNHKSIGTNSYRKSNTVNDSNGKLIMVHLGNNNSKVLASKPANTSMQKTITKIPYRYCDDMGHKVYGSIYVNGKLEDIRHVERIAYKLDHGIGFIPAQLNLGIEELQTQFPTFPSTHDHPFHEIDFGQRTCMRLAPVGANVIDLDRFVAAFDALADTDTWDVAAAAKRLGLVEKEGLPL